MNKINNKAYLYLLPSILLLIIFVIFPLINTIIISFSNGALIEVFSEEKFTSGLKNTIMYAIIATPIIIMISLYISYLLSLNIKFKKTFQTIFFIPYVTSTIAIGAVWVVMYHSDYGIFNAILENIGLSRIEFLNDPRYSFMTILLFGIWKGLAFNILMIYTALMTIDDSLEKAALIDGTSSIKTFFKVKLPQIYPVLTFLIINGMIHSIKIFEESISLYNGMSLGGPSGGTSAMTAILYIKTNVIENPEMAAAASVVVFSITLLLTFFNKKATNYFTRRSR